MQRTVAHTHTHRNCVVPTAERRSHSTRLTSAHPTTHHDARAQSTACRSASVTTPPAAATQTSAGPTWVSREARKSMFDTAQEITEPVQAEISGQLPPWLEGDLVANGTGYNEGMVHLFDGLAMLTKLSVRGGKVTATQRFLQTQQWQHLQRTGRLRWREFITEIPTNSVWDKVQMSDGVTGQLQTAHPKLLPCGKRVVNFVRTLPKGDFDVVIQDLETLQRKVIATFPGGRPFNPSWTHDISVSQNHVIILETPLLINMGRMMFGGEKEYYILDWAPELQTRVHVCKLDGSQVMRTLSLDRMKEYPGQQMNESYLWRITIPQSAPTGSRLNAPQPLTRSAADHGAFCEFPSVNPKYRSKPYRYAYSLAAKRPTNMGNALAKYDTHTGEVKLWHEDECAPGEPLFVPAPNAQSEDEGVVICNIMGKDGRTFLLVLDGQSFTEVARAKLPFGVPYRFHGTWIPA